MYCVIQRVVNKKPTIGSYTELLQDSEPVIIDGVARTRYGFKYGPDRFERPIRDAFKISIHRSYREAGRILKQQWVICTVGYYDLLFSTPREHVNPDTLAAKLKEMGIKERQLWHLVHEKLDPLISDVKAAFEVTEESREVLRQTKVLKLWRLRMARFDKLHGAGTYQLCYDIYGDLRDPHYWKQLMDAYEEKEQFQRERRQREQEQDESGNYNSNYGEEFEKILARLTPNYAVEEKVLLKKFYRKLAKEFHPDVTKDDGAAMVLLNKLKDNWGI
jgi:hypothetical protein